MTEIEIANRSALVRSEALLGARASLVGQDRLLSVIDQHIEARERLIVASLNLHSLYLIHHDDSLRDLHAIANIVRVDGMAIVVLGRLVGLPIKRSHRITWLDFITPLASQAAIQSWRILYLGGRPGVAEAAAAKLREKHQGLDVHAVHGYFDLPSDSAAARPICDTINSIQPDILMVGMGMPRQERWVLENQHRLDAPVIMPCGALFDYVAGVVATPPRWLGRIGLEWLFRLLNEPGRLATRYLIEPWFILGLLARSFLKSQSLAGDHEAR